MASNIANRPKVVVVATTGQTSQQQPIPIQIPPPEDKNVILPESPSSNWNDVNDINHKTTSDSLPIPPPHETDSHVTSTVSSTVATIVSIPTIIVPSITPVPVAIVSVSVTDFSLYNSKHNIQDFDLLKVSSSHSLCFTVIE